MFGQIDETKISLFGIRRGLTRLVGLSQQIHSPDSGAQSWNMKIWGCMSAKGFWGDDIYRWYHEYLWIYLKDGRQGDSDSAEA